MADGWGHTGFPQKNLYVPGCLCGRLKAHERKVHRRIGMLAATSSTSRLTASFEYVGPAVGPGEGTSKAAE
jgi:hypothetical protein